MCMYISIFRAVSSRSIYVRLTFPLQSNIDIPRNSFRAGAVVQYNGFLRMCVDTTLTYHGRASLSLIYITSESSILTGFHTILRSNFNIKTRLHVSLVLNLLRVIPVTSPQWPLHVTRPRGIHYMLPSFHSGGPLHVTQSPQEWWSTTHLLSLHSSGLLYVT